MRLPYLGDDVPGALQRFKHRGSLLAPVSDVLALRENLLDIVRLVQMGNKLRLKVVFDKIDKEVHDRLGDAVLDRFANNIEIGFDETFNDIAVALLSLGKFSRVLCRHLGQQIDGLERTEHAGRRMGRRGRRRGRRRRGLSVQSGRQNVRQPTASVLAVQSLTETTNK